MTRDVDAVFHYARAGFLFAVYPDRIDITETRLRKPQTTSYRIADVANVSVTSVPGTLHLTLLDGSMHAYQLSGEATTAHHSILALL